MSWNALTKEKSELPDVLEPFLIKFNRINNKIQFLRCDNAGEHQTKLRSLCSRLGIQLEYTAPYTPQMNGVVERKFVTARDRGNAMLKAANLKHHVQLDPWAEAVNTATKIGNISIFPGETKTPYEKFYNIKPKLTPPY
jgi:hypothetical protein